MTMSNDSTNVPTTSPTILPVETEQEVLLSQLVKQESKSACSALTSTSIQQEASIIQGTIMVKVEEISKENIHIMDDTLVKPPLTTTPDAPPTQQQQQSLPLPPTNTTTNNEQTTSIIQPDTAIALETPAPTPITTFEEIQKQLKNTLDHVEQRNMVSGFQTLSKATGAVVDHCEQLGKNILHNKG